MTGKQRMLNAYRGLANDRVAIAPEFWYYYPAKLLGVDMIEFSREVPFHRALKSSFEAFACEGWGVAFCGPPNPDISDKTEEVWLDEETLETRHTTSTPHGELTSRSRISRDEPAWAVERGIKDFPRDLPAWECVAFGGDLGAMDPSGLVAAWEEVGESYLLEGWLGVPFFDTIGGAFDGGLEAAVYAFLEHESEMERLQERHTAHLVEKARLLCEKTPIESFCIGCSWSCNSLIGPDMWRRWDKPGVRAVCEELHRHGRLLHIHFHGRCMETVADFAEIGIDCVCPFERPPGGDVAGLSGLAAVSRLLDGKVTMNGNIHTVETLIRGTPDDVRREVGEVLEVFGDSPRVILGTGDQVGRETPEENLRALVEEAKRLGGGRRLSSHPRSPVAP